MEFFNVYLIISGLLCFIALYVIRQILLKNKYPVDKNYFDITNFYNYYKYLKSNKEIKNKKRKVTIGIISLVILINFVIQLIIQLVSMIRR